MRIRPRARGSRQTQCVEKMEGEKEVAHLTNEVPHLTLDNFHLDSQVEKPLTFFFFHAFGVVLVGCSECSSFQITGKYCEPLIL